MKSDKKILLAFLLNLFFSVFEFVGGLFTKSIAIISDAIHDVGDALSIGISYFLEKKSKKHPDEIYTYGYLRYSVLGGLITSLVLFCGSLFVIINAIERIINPVEINYNGMIIFAVFGVVINFFAAMATHGGHSVNQKAVNLHMIEDVLGWIVVLIGSIVMKFTDISIIDPLMSIAVALFILVNSIKNISEILNLFLEKTPSGIDVSELKNHLMSIDGIIDVHHIHIWSMDNENHYATMHIVSEEDFSYIKKLVREELKEHHIHHVTIEMEHKGEECPDTHCHIKSEEHHHHHHHGHHGHH